MVSSFFVRCKRENRRFSGAKSRFSRAADRIKDAASRADELIRGSLNVLTLRTVTAEYLLAMKLMSGRRYKYDLSDVVGILWEQERKGQPLTLDQIRKATVDLYDSYDRLPLEFRSFLEKVLADGDYEAMYGRIRKMEAENKEILIEYQEEKPGVIKDRKSVV